MIDTAFVKDAQQLLIGQISLCIEIYSDSDEPNYYLKLLSPSGQDWYKPVKSLHSVEIGVLNWLLKIHANDFETVSFNDDIDRLLALLEKHSCHEKIEEIKGCLKLWL